MIGQNILLVVIVIIFKLSKFGKSSLNCRNRVLIWIFIAIVRINIRAIKFEDITVTFQPKRPSRPVIIKTEKKQLLIGTIIQISFLNINHRVAIINKRTPRPKTIISLLINDIISSVIIGIPPKYILPTSP